MAIYSNNEQLISHSSELTPIIFPELAASKGNGKTYIFLAIGRTSWSLFELVIYREQFLSYEKIKLVPQVEV